MLRFISALLICGLCLLGNTVFAGSLLVTEDKLFADDAAVSDNFGRSVAVSGDTVVVGAVNDDDAGTSSGSAYVFVRDTDGMWSQQQKLTADDAAEGDLFGIDVAVHGDTVVVGTARRNGSSDLSGAAYVFVRDTDGMWSQQQKLLANDVAAGDRFGNTVAIEGETVVVGAWGVSTGSAYVFTRAGTTWFQRIKLLANDATFGDRFGRSVSLGGNTIVIGATESGGAVPDSGAAYVFTGVGAFWSQQAKLIAGDGADNDKFGTSVAVSGDTVVVGAFWDDDAGTDSGSAYVFMRSGTTWAEQQKLTAGDAAADDEFGNSVAVSGDTVVVGAHKHDDVGINSGSAYAFVRSKTNWLLLKKLAASDARAVEQFGDSVAINGNTVVVGAGLGDSTVNNTGAAYVLKLFSKLEGKVAGTTFCDFGAGTTKSKLKDPSNKEPSNIFVDTSRVPVITAAFIIPGTTKSVPLTGVALLKNPKSGVFQLFGTDGETKFALTGSMKINKKTGIWKVLNGKIQIKGLDGDSCVSAGKIKLK
jgi:FG-GAP repeat